MSRRLIIEGEEFIAEVCWRYYISGQTQEKIARSMDVTRLKVNQTIQKAKSMGMINIQICSPFVTRIELQQRLESQLGLQQALVSPMDTENSDCRIPIGAALAHFLTTQMDKNAWKKIGVSWGSTLQRAIERLPYQPQKDLEILAFMGGTTTGSLFNTFSVASGFASKFDASYSHLLAPIYLPENVNRDEFLDQQIYKKHLDACRSADAVLLVVGDVSHHSHVIQYGLPEEIQAAKLRKAGAVGDLLGHFLDIHGNEIDHSINQRVAGVKLSVLANIDNTILTAAGEHKVPIINAVIQRGFVDTLITDEMTAQLLLDYNTKKLPPANTAKQH